MHEGVDVDGLGEIEVTPRGPAEPVYHVVHIGVPEARVDDPTRLRLVVAVGIGEENEFRGAANIGSALHGHN